MIPPVEIKHDRHCFSQVDHPDGFQLRLFSLPNFVASEGVVRNHCKLVL
jgi:hypothetical protein